jgi:hypothetical protein
MFSITGTDEKVLYQKRIKGKLKSVLPLIFSCRFTLVRYTRGQIHQAPG